MSVSGVSGSAGLTWQQTRTAKSALAAAAGQSPVSGTTSGETGLPASAGSAVPSSGTPVATSPTLSASMLGSLLKTQEQGSGTTTSDDAARSADGEPVGGSAVGSKKPSADDPVATFMNWMNETPTQRMFDSFLSSHNISKADYAAMSAKDKAKIQAEFRDYMKQKMEEKTGHTGATSTQTAST